MNIKWLRLILFIGVGLQFVLNSAAHGSKTTIVKHTETSDPHSDGFWTRKVGWKSRWVKYWRPKTIYVPVWKKVWGPIEQNEWVPLPNAPPGWQKSSSSDQNMQVKEVNY